MLAAGYVSTISALAGTVIGGLTTLLTTWLTHIAQTKANRVAAERARREEIYGRFIDELAVLYSLALSDDGLSYGKLVPAIALRGRIMLMATSYVVESANQALSLILDIHMGPRLTTAQMRQAMENGTANAIPAFAEACRRELLELRLV